MTAKVTEEVYTVNEVATIFRLPIDAVRRLIRSGELPAIRFGHTYRVPKRIVEQYLALPASSYLPQEMGFGMWAAEVESTDAVDYVERLRDAETRTLREVVADLWSE